MLCIHAGRGLVHGTCTSTVHITGNASSHEVSATVDGTSTTSISNVDINDQLNTIRMDESSLPDIAQLLSGAIGPSTRGATCTAIAACSSGSAGASLRYLIGTTPPGETIIRRLLLLCGDPSCARLALSALINISEDESAAATMTRAGAVERAATALLDTQQSHLSALYAGLLSNVTRFSFGVDALVGKGMGESASAQAVNRLFKLVTKIDRIPNVLWMSNTCSTAEGRGVLLLKGNVDQAAVDTSRQPLTWLLRLFSSQKDDIRLAAGSALRNCAMSEDCHIMLVQHTNAIGTCLARLMSSIRPIPLEKVKDAPEEVRVLAINPANAKPEPLVEIRQMLVESLLLLCKTRIGRDALRERAVYIVLDEWKHIERNKEIGDNIESILDRLAVAEDEKAEDLAASDLANGTSVVEIVGAD